MTLQLYDLGDVVSIVLGSMAGVLAAFQIVRSLFLDRLTKGRLDATQQNVLYHALVWLIIAGLIVVQAVLKGYQFNVMLVASAIVAAFPIQRGVNLIFNGVQQVKPLAAQGMAVMQGSVASLAPSAPVPAAAADAPDPFAPLTLPDVPDVPATPAPADAQPDPDAPIVVAQD